MKEAVTSVLFKKYNDINSRASRSEYWWYALFSFLAALLCQSLDALFGWQFGQPDAMGNRSGVLVSLFYVATFIPAICVAVRRLHDVNRSGWWMLITFTIIGLIPLTYWMIKKPEDSEDGRENKWGKNPLLNEL